MSKAIRLNGLGGPEKLEIFDIPDEAPGPNQVAIQQTVIGLNFIDIYHRKGLYPIEAEPKIPGIEAVGVIESVGEGVEGFKPGDRVAYATAPVGAYRERRVVDERFIVGVPEDFDDKQAVALLAKGMTAHMLIRRTFKVKRRNTIVVYAAAGGVGQMLCRWAGNHIGARVIGIVGSDQKKQIALENGCSHAINYRKEDVYSIIEELTEGAGVNVVYDSVGKDTFETSCSILMPTGLLVSFGQASGAVPSFDMSKLAERCIFVTRPRLDVYKQFRYELVLTANEVFHQARNGVLKAKVNKTYQFNQIAQAHTDIEGRRTVGSNVLMVG